MKVAANTLADVPRAQRAELKKLLDERAVMQYTFSYAKLASLLEKLDCPDIPAALLKCIVAFKEEDAKSTKEGINDDIQALFMEAGLAASESGAITLNEPDPFGRMKDFIYMRSTSTSFSKQACIDMLIRRFKLDAEAVLSVFDHPKVTEKKPFATVQARDHKDKPEHERQSSKKGRR